MIGNEKEYTMFVVYSFQNKKDFNEKSPFSTQIVKWVNNCPDFQIFKCVLNLIMNNPDSYHVVVDVSTEDREKHPSMTIRLSKFFVRFFGKEVSKPIVYNGDKKHCFLVKNFSQILFNNKKKELIENNYVFDELSESIVEFT